MIIIAGKNNIAVNALIYIKTNTNYNVKIVCNETETGYDTWQRSLRLAAMKLGVEEITIEDAYKQAELFISLEFDKIIDINKFAKARAYNIHFSLLPKYRGMYTSIWPILNSEKETGVTLHEIDSGIDSGRIIDQIIIPIAATDRAKDIYNKYLDQGFSLFKRCINALISNDYKAKKQNSSFSSYYSKNSISFNKINLNIIQPADDIIKDLFAFSFRDYQLLKFKENTITNAVILEYKSSEKAGSIITDQNNFIEASTIDYNIRLYKDRMSDLKRLGFCSIEEAKSILSGLCGIHDKNSKGHSPIIVASCYGNYEVLKFLLQHGANINDSDNSGVSVLMYAAKYALKTKNKTIFNYLILSKADLYQKDYTNKTLLEHLKPQESRFLELM